MKLSRALKAASATVIATILLSSIASAQSFLYRNDDNTPNGVSGYAIAPDGSLTLVPGSPFLTGGDSVRFGLIAPHRTAIEPVGRFIYASNITDNTVSGFSIDAGTGALSLIPGSPFALAGDPGNGSSIAATPDGQYLIVTHESSRDATVFSIGADGSLTLVPGSPFALGIRAAGIKISPDGEFLFVGAPTPRPGTVGVYSISPAGTLLPVAGSPFPVGGSGFTTDVDIDCSGLFAFASEANLGDTIVDVFSIGPGSSLTSIPGSPFVPGVGSNSNVLLLSPDDETLFVSNQNSRTITAMSVAPDGSLSLVPGAPFATNPVGFPALMATTADGGFLYAADSFSLSGYTVATDGSLSPVPGSPLTTAEAGPAIVVYPPKSCDVRVAMDIRPGDDGPNNINRRSRGRVPVAVLGSPALNAASIVRASLSFAGAAPLNNGGGLEDVNGDGRLDLIVHFAVQSLDLPEGATEACLRGETVDDRVIDGCDVIRVK